MKDRPVAGSTAEDLSDLPCRCRMAVERCYRGLCRCGQPERHALEAAVVVYRYHHPETPQLQAEAIVSGWVQDGTRH